MTVFSVLQRRRGLEPTEELTKRWKTYNFEQCPSQSIDSFESNIEPQWKYMRAQSASSIPVECGLRRQLWPRTLVMLAPDADIKCDMFMGRLTPIIVECMTAPPSTSTGSASTTALASRSSMPARILYRQDALHVQWRGCNFLSDSMHCRPRILTQRSKPA